MELSGSADDAERCRIRATKCIGERVIIGIRRSHGTADALSGCRVFCDGSGGAIAVGEHGGAVLINICDIDRDGNAITPAVAIRNRNRHRIGVLRFIV